jgi:hypothetical protein
MNDTNNMFELGSPRVTRGAIPNDTRRTACVSLNDPSDSMAILIPEYIPIHMLWLLQNTNVDGFRRN